MNHPSKKQKAELRTRFRQQRRLISEDQYRERSRAICERLTMIDELRTARTVHTFWPIHANREVDITPFLLQLMTSGVRLVLPVLRTASDTELEHHCLTSPQDLVPSLWGGLEPSEVQAVSCSDLDAVIVPALAVDAKGFRLGYGGGHYDRFLARVDIPRICPIFHEMLVPALPREDHDMPVSIIVTEKSTIRPL